MELWQFYRQVWEEERALKAAEKEDVKRKAVEKARRAK
jgi:hypothetical protein